MRRRLLRLLRSNGIVLPDYDTDTYPYYALVKGTLIESEGGNESYCFVVTGNVKTFIPSAGVWKFTTNYCVYQRWYSEDGQTWTGHTTASASTIGTNLDGYNAADIVDSNYLT